PFVLRCGAQFKQEATGMTRCLLILVLSTWLGCSGKLFSQTATPGTNNSPGGEPNQMLPAEFTPNPALAQSIVKKLQESGQLFQYRVHVIATSGGIVTLNGDISDESQREVVIHLLRTVPGITMVRDALQVRPAVNTVAGQMPMFPAVIPVQ